jgi:N4-gp56 family major capsid protein
MGMQYNNPVGGTASTVGSQIRTDNFIKQALIEVKKDQYFSPLADTTAMPKNMGKKIKRYHYVPLLDDANLTDQGIDAAGVIALGAGAVFECTLIMTKADGSIPWIPILDGCTNVGGKIYFTGTAASAILASDAARDKVINWANQIKVAQGLGLAVAAGDAGFATLVNTGAGSAYDLGFRFTDNKGVTVTTATGLDTSVVSSAGNLYGSSKDIGTITGKFPTLTETGGRVNRVGFTRVELEGTFKKYGFFDEYTQESLDFDTDSELEMHINREMIFGANEIVEDLLQLDLLTQAGVVYYAGGGVSNSTMTGVTASGITEVTYADLSRLSVELDNNRCPKTTKVISGSRMVDTKVIRAGRVMYIGSELTLTVEQMKDYFNNQAFISVAHYADAGSVLNGEIGTVGQFRMVVVPEMMHWAGVGAAEGTNAGYRATAAKYDVFPMLVVGDASFTTIGFQTSGASSKFTIKHAKPGSPESYANDPYGETGFMSIKWYYGFMALRPERIAVLKTVAKI